MRVLPFLCAGAVACSLIDLNGLAGDGGAADAADATNADADIADADAGAHGYRRTITITAPAANVPAAYTIRVALDSPALAHAKGDLADVRVLAADLSELDRVADVAPPNDAPAVWFAVPAAIASSAQATYWLYYGDVDATHVTPTKVFAFWDDFGASTLAPVWLVNDAGNAPTLGDGGLTLVAPAELTTDYASDGVPTHSALEVVARTTGGTQYWFGYQRDDDFVESNPFVIWMADSNAGRIYANSAENCSSSCTSSIVTQTNVARWYRIERGAATTRYFIDGVLTLTANDVPTNDLSIKLKNGADPQIVVSLVRARALLDPEPTVTLGPEMPAP